MRPRRALALRSLTRRQVNTSSRLHNIPPTGKFSAYTSRLTALSTRTGVSLPSLALSFGILHELTALVPLVLLFWAFQAADVGTNVVSWAGKISNEDADGWKGYVRDWLSEGEKRVDRVARRYGLFGMTKGAEGRSKGVEVAEEARELVMRAEHGSRAAAGVTNAIAAYVFVKVRLTCSVWCVRN
jgi:hypothetical protein